MRVVPNLYPIVDAPAATTRATARARHRRARGRDPLARPRPRPSRSSTTSSAIEVLTVIRDRVPRPPRRRARVRAGVREPGQGCGRVDRAPARADRRPRPRARGRRGVARRASRRPTWSPRDLADARTRRPDRRRRPRARVVPVRGVGSLRDAGRAPLDREPGSRRRPTPRSRWSRSGSATRSPRCAATLGDVAVQRGVPTAPPGRPAGEFHWYVDVIPRLSIVAGFEEGTGMLVNTVAPEQAAVLLRDAGAGRARDRRGRAVRDDRRHRPRRCGRRWRTSRRTPSGWPTRSRSRSAPSSDRASAPSSSASPGRSVHDDRRDDGDRVASRAS